MSPNPWSHVSVLTFSMLCAAFDDDAPPLLEHDDDGVSGSRISWGPITGLSELLTNNTSFWPSPIEMVDSTSTCRGWWVTGSIPIFFNFFFMCVFHWFLMSLSVLPGRREAILDHLHIFNSENSNGYHLSSSYIETSKWEKRMMNWSVKKGCESSIVQFCTTAPADSSTTIKSQVCIYLFSILFIWIFYYCITNNMVVQKLHAEDPHPSIKGLAHFHTL